MTYQFATADLDLEQPHNSEMCVDDPRIVMVRRLPQRLQPFLTWLTAKPPCGEAVRERSPLFFVRVACAQTGGGFLLTAAAMAWAGALPAGLLCALVLLGLVLTTSGLGLFQVVIFHHCSHGTVFQDRSRNVLVGRLISAILLFKHFEAYKAGHMLHHSNKKLLTEEDEFADFVMGMMGFRAAVPKRQLWHRVIVSLISPAFHARFLVKRIAGAWRSPDRAHNLIGVAAWGGMAAVALATGQFEAFLVGWVLPVTVLLQAATVFRILCEHRFPDPELIRLRGRDFACHATAGVFPGAMPPDERATTLRGCLLWAVWWADMLTLQLLVRVIVLVGDAPCHDYHHRRPASRRWTSYIQARQVDVETNASGFQTPYQEVWGLFRALDENLDSLARTPPESIPNFVS